MSELSQLRLFLLRHGKASDDAPTDFERPLKKRGQQQAEKKGQILRCKIPHIDTILCSAAKRTCETLQYLNINASDIITTKKLYLCDPEIILNQIQLVHNAKSILVIGHNPSIHQLAYDLLPSIRQNPTQQEEMLALSFPTCALAEFHFNCENWSKVTWHKGKLASFCP